MTFFYLFILELNKKLQFGLAKNKKNKNWIMAKINLMDAFPKKQLSDGLFTTNSHPTNHN